MKRKMKQKGRDQSRPPKQAGELRHKLCQVTQGSPWFSEFHSTVCKKHYHWECDRALKIALRPQRRFGKAKQCVTTILEMLAEDIYRCSSEMMTACNDSDDFIIQMGYFVCNDFHVMMKCQNIW